MSLTLMTYNYKSSIHINIPIFYLCSGNTICLSLSFRRGNTMSNVGSAYVVRQRIQDRGASGIFCK